MSIHEGMHVWQKAAWIILIGVLLRIELRAIAKDRWDSSQEAAKQQAEQAERFSAVLDQQSQDFARTAQQLRDAYRLSKRQFQVTVDKVNGVLSSTQSVANVAKGTLDAIVGQDSVPCLIPYTVDGLTTISGAPLQIWDVGPNPLTGVSIQQEYSANEEIGTLTPSFPKPTLIKLHLDRGGIPPVVVNINIWTQNGTYWESLRFTPAQNSEWTFTYALFIEMSDEAFNSKYRHGTPSFTAYPSHLVPVPACYSKEQLPTLP